MTRFLKHKLVQDSLILGGVQISGYVLPLVTLPYLTRVLGPANFGLIALGSALTLYFVVIVEFGFAVTGTRRIAILQKDLPRVWRTYCNIMGCKLILVVTCFVLMIALVGAIPKLREYWPLYMVSYLQVIGQCLSPNWLLQGMQRMKLVAYSDYGGKILTVALIFLLVRHSSDYLIAAALQSGAFLISAVLGMLVASRALRMRIVRPTFTEMRALMIEGWPVFLSFASGNVISSSNTMILGMTAAPEQVGFLNAASRLIIAFRALANPIASAVYPHMSQLAAQSPAEAVRFLKRRIFWTPVPFLLLTVGLILFAPLAVNILYGPRYHETGILLRLMSVIPFVHASSMCFGTHFMLAFGHEKAWSKVITRSLLVNFAVLAILMLFLLPDRAVALTTSLTDIFVLGSCMWFYFANVKVLESQTTAAPRELT